MRALVCCLALLVSTLAAAPNAFAQAEDRGYGGPATVGPNFSTGKQSAPPERQRRREEARVQKAHGRQEAGSRQEQIRSETGQAEARVEDGREASQIKSRRQEQPGKRRTRYCVRDLQVGRRNHRRDVRGYKRNHGLQTRNLPPLRRHNQHHRRSRLQLTALNRPHPSSSSKRAKRAPDGDPAQNARAAHPIATLTAPAQCGPALSAQSAGKQGAPRQAAPPRSRPGRAAWNSRRERKQSPPRNETEKRKPARALSASPQSERRR